MMNNPMQMLNQLKQNPMQFIMQKGFNLPNGIGNDPNKIIQHLMKTGQISQQQYDNAVKMAQQFKK